jgi:hypothetical protein
LVGWGVVGVSIERCTSRKKKLTADEVLLEELRYDVGDIGHVHLTHGVRLRRCGGVLECIYKMLECIYKIYTSIHPSIHPFIIFPLIPSYLVDKAVD